MFWVIIGLAMLSLSMAFGVIVFTVLGAVSDLMGAPFVPTSQREIGEILAKARLKKGQVFLELGSGDGRVVRTAVKNYGVVGVGVEIHPMLVWYSRLLARWQKLKGLRFLRQNFFKTELGEVDVIFLFLMPKTMRKLQDRMLYECKKGTVVISHGFEVPALEKLQFDRIDSTYYPTFYYKLN